MESLSKQADYIIAQLLLNKEVLRIKFTHSSGPGGQHVNKTNTKAELFLNVSRLSETFLTKEQKERLIIAAKNFYHSNKNIILLYNQESRNAILNKRSVLEHLKGLFITALRQDKKRIETKVPYSVSEQRIEEKKKRGTIKKGRIQKDFLLE